MRSKTLINQIKEENDIDNLKNLFLEVINKHESEMVEIHEANTIQNKFFQQEIREKTSELHAIKLEHKTFTESVQKEIQQYKINEIKLKELLNTAYNENSILKNKLEELQNSQQRLTATTINFRKHISNIKHKLTELNQNNLTIKSTVFRFSKSIHHFFNLSRQVFQHSYSYIFKYKSSIETLKSGLLSLKQQIHAIRTPRFPRSTFHTLKFTIHEQISSYISKRINKEKNIFNDQKQKFKKQIFLSTEDLLKILASIQIINASTSSQFAMIVIYFQNQLKQIRNINKHILNMYQKQKIKHSKKIKSYKQEIFTLKNDISLLQKTNQITKEKSKISETNKKKKLTIKKRSKSPIRSEKVPVQCVDVATQSSIMNMHQIRDRLIRRSKETELTITLSELKRVRNENKKLINQIGGLQKSITRNNDNTSIKNNENMKTIKNLEEQLHDEKLLNQKKKFINIKMKKEFQEMKFVASKVDPLKNAILEIFNNCKNKLETLIVDDKITDELVELDELSLEFLDIPIHYLCNPIVSMNFIKKQETILMNAMNNNVKVEEITQVFNVMIEEILKRSKTKAIE